MWQEDPRQDLQGPISHPLTHSLIAIFVLDLGNKTIQAPLKSGRVPFLGPSLDQKETLITNQHLPDGLDISSSQKRLYWTNMGSLAENDGSVLSANFDGTEVTTIVPKGEVHTPKQLVIDDHNGKLYFADREGLRVMRCNLDGSALENIIQTGDWKNAEHAREQTRWCIGVALSPRTGKIFWSQKGGARDFQGRIFHSDIEKGQAKPNLLLENLPEPVDLYFDDERSILYGTSRGEEPFGSSLNALQLDTLDSSFWNQKKPRILARGFHDLIGLVVDTDERYAYVADMGGSINKCNVVDGGKERIHHDQNSVFTGIARSRL